MTSYIREVNWFGPERQDTERQETERQETERQENVLIFPGL